MGSIGNSISSSNEYAGTYELYRAGDLSGGPTGLVFFAVDRETAERYGKASSFKMQGKTYKRPKREVNEYSVELKNPLVVEASDDIHTSIQAYNKLHPNKQIGNEFDGSIARYAKEEGMKVTGRDSMAIYLDTSNGKALANSKYDGIIYKTQLRSSTPQVSQIIVSKNSKQIKKRRKR